MNLPILQKLFNDMPIVDMSLLTYGFFEVNEQASDFAQQGCAWLEWIGDYGFGHVPSGVLVSPAYPPLADLTVYNGWPLVLDTPGPVL